MGKPKKQRKTFNYNKDRRKEWQRSKKMPTIHCAQIRQAWDEKKSMLSNLEDMGISANPNKTIHIPTAQELLGPQDIVVKKKGKKKDTKHHVWEELAAEAAVPEQKRLKLSEPDTAYCISMMEKYGEDYKAMARDEENYYQDTPKQIARKIRTFRSIPDQYNAYLASRGSSA